MGKVPGHAGPGILARAKILKSLATSLADALMADFCLFCYYLWVLLVSKLIERHAAKIQGRSAGLLKKGL